MTVRIGIIGFGAIGQELHRAVVEGRAGDTVCAGILVRTGRAGAPAALTADPAAFFGRRYDAVIECAGHDAVGAHGEAALRAGADLLVTAVGALADDALRERLLVAARMAGRRLIVPSAGIGAIDILAAAAVGGLDRVTVTVRKDPESWRGTAAERDHDLDALGGPVVLYEGPVREGARLYPGNVNISAAVALAGIGLDRTRLRIVADPAIATHVVQVEAAGTFGRFAFEEEVIPSEANRKTGRLVAMALVKTVRQLSATMVVGA